MAKREKRYAPVGHPDRATAAEWAALYRKALADPDGVYVERDQDGLPIIYIDSRNPEHLIALLERYARFGTFNDRDSTIADMARRVLMRAHYKQLRAQGHKREEAIELLAQENGVSDTTIERWLGFRC